MSERFVQINIPCNDCLVSPVCQDKKTIDHTLSKYELFNFMLSLRKWDESQKCYRKGLMEAWVNNGADIMRSMSTSEFNDLPNHAVPEYLNALIEIVNTLEWMVNSTSWREGKMYDFDKTEFKNKLKQALAWV